MTAPQLSIALRTYAAEDPGTWQPVLDLGVGIGWQREEYQAAGLDFGVRGRQLDLTLEVCQTLWREQRAKVDVAGLSFGAIHMMPKPLQPGGVPIWVSGRLNGRVA